MPGNKLHPDKNNTSSSWQKGSISGINLEPSIQPQHVTGLDPWCRLVCHPDIQ